MTPDQIRAWRERMGLSQARAAKLLGVGTRYYQRLEAGDRTPSQTVIILMHCKEICHENNLF